MIKREVARRNPPTQILGERNLLISPAIQMAQEFKKKLDDNSLNDQLTNITNLIKEPDNTLSTQTITLIQALDEQHTEINKLREQNNDLYESNKILGKNLDNATKIVEKLTQDKEQLTKVLEQEQKNNLELQDKLNYLEQKSVYLAEVGMSSSKVKNNNSNNEISITMH